MIAVKRSFRNYMCHHIHPRVVMSSSSSTSSFSSAGKHIVCASGRTMSSSPMMEASAEEESNFALILGKPGGGKGTISGKILEDFPQFHHVSSGDLLRSHVSNETDIGVEAKRYIEEGKLVPDQLIIGVVMEESYPYLERGESLLLDGFPRTVGQAKALEESVHVDIVVNLDVPNETIVERLTDRWIHEPSGRIYSYAYKPPRVEGKDDETGEPLIQRHDDKPETVRARLKQYDKSTSPLVQYYERNGVLKSFHGTQSDVIYPKVKNWLESCFDQ